jgi:hypothetical protein
MSAVGPEHPVLLLAIEDQVRAALNEGKSLGVAVQIPCPHGSGSAIGEPVCCAFIRRYLRRRGVAA